MTTPLHRLATSLRPRLPAVLLLVVVAAVTPALWIGEMPEPWWQIGMIVAAVTAAVVNRYVNHNPWVFGAVTTVATLHLVVSETHHDLDDLAVTPWIDIIGDLSVVIAVALMLTYVVIRRMGRPQIRDLVEAVVVLIGASMATWVLLTEPLIDRGIPAFRAVMTSLVLPVSLLVATFSVDLWNDGLRQNRALRLAACAGLLLGAASAVTRLRLVDTVPIDATGLHVALYSLSAGFLFAAMSHADFSYEAFGRSATEGEPGSETRLMMMGGAVLVAVTLTAMSAPSGNSDIAVRVAGTFALIGLVVARLAIALREHAHARAALERRINCDDLTGLSTRPHFIQIVAETIEQHWRSEFHPTVIHVNLDRFKTINDSFGHHGANSILVEVARRLDRVATAMGAHAARLGGDDFVIVDGSTRILDDALERVDVVRAALSEPVTVGESTVYVSTTIGVAMAPAKRSLSAEELVRRADIANHRAKLDGANRTAVFDDSMQANAAERMEIEHALHGAIGRQEMRLYHQPIVDIATGRVSGFESLMRWQRSEDHVVGPGGFIAIAEDTGIICELGAWALSDALHQLRTWIDAGVVEPTTTISVNVSPRQIADPNFATIVRQILDGSGVPAHLLWLEMTESMMLEEPELAQSTLREIRSMGIRLALDDFGTGFSSLSLLQQFPIQRIKIDRAFVQGIAENSNDRSLVRTIIAMAHSMGLDLVAEGVETVHQLHSLRDLGCNKAQGYLISRPVPPDAMRSTMRALEEMVDLSLFSPPSHDTSRHADAVGSSSPEPAAYRAGPVGLGTRGPLGQPVV